MKQVLFCAFIIFSALSVSAQKKSASRSKVSRDEITIAIAAYVDSLENCKVRLDSMKIANDSLSSQAKLADSRFYRLFSPLTYYPEVAARLINENVPDADNLTDNQIDSILVQIYTKHPELIVTTVRSLHRSAAEGEIAPTAPVYNKLEVVKEADAQPVGGVPEQGEVNIVVVKPNFWKFNGDYSLQFLQNYISDNWYKSGESNLSMVGSATLKLDYNNKQKVKFENTLEMKVGIQTSESDSLHQYKTSQDLLRYTGKFGLQASKKWYYTAQVIATTQFLRGFKSNDANVYSDIFSPLELNVSLGMDYNVEAWKKRLTGSIHIAPLAYNMKYVSRLGLATRFGIEEGRHTLHDYGSQFTLNVTWKPSDMVKWTSRLYGYTTYHRAVVEWENTISFALSKYISTNLYLYPRFDDSAQKKDGWSYFQLKEYFSLGFSYSM